MNVTQRKQKFRQTMTRILKFNPTRLVIDGQGKRKQNKKISAREMFWLKFNSKIERFSPTGRWVMSSAMRFVFLSIITADWEIQRENVGMGKIFMVQFDRTTFNFSLFGIDDSWPKAHNVWTFTSPALSPNKHKKRECRCASSCVRRENN